MAGFSTFSFAQSNVIVENGISYTKILTVSEYQSVGGGFASAQAEEGAAKKKKSGTILWCKKGGGCCFKVEMDSDATGVINSMIVIDQIADDGSHVDRTLGLFAYYNSEVDEIIYR